MLREWRGNDFEARRAETAQKVRQRRVGNDGKERTVQHLYGR